MKVKQLISELKKLNKDSEVEVRGYISDDGSGCIEADGKRINIEPNE